MCRAAACVPTQALRLASGGHLRRSRTISQGNTGGHLTSPGPGFPSCVHVANFSLPICGCQDDLCHARHRGGEAACQHRTGDRDQGPGAKGASRIWAQPLWLWPYTSHLRIWARDPPGSQV